MRKKCHRNIRPIARPLTPKQKADLLLGPRLHLHLLLIAQYELTYICSVAWVFNMAVAMAFEADRQDLLAYFIPAQDIVLSLMNELRAPTTEEGDVLRQAFNVADDWIARQNAASIARASKYAGREWPKN